MTWIEWAIGLLAALAASFAAAVAYGRWLERLGKARLRDAYTPREVVIGQVEVPPQIAADMAAAAERRGVKGGEW